MSEGMLGGIIALCVGLLLLLIMGGIAAFMFRNVAASRNWQPTTGQVLSSRIVVRYSEEGGGTDYPDVTYGYSVMGQQYQSDRIFVGGAVGGLGARKTIERYPVGSPVQVYFNPQRPDQAVLERRSPTAVFLAILGGVMGLITCGAGLLLILTQ
jgi:hypothetical protein